MANQIPYSGVSAVEPQIDGSGARYQDVPAANPDAFGAQIGQNLSKLGQAGEEVGGKALDVATEFNKMATEARAENDFANQYATGAAQLRQKFDSLDDKDKIAGSVEYISGLRNLGQNFTGDEAKGSPYYKQLMSQLIGRHVFAETTGIDKEVVGATTAVAAQSKLALMAANNGYAAQNYDNPQVIDQMEQSNAGLRTLQVMNAGHDPSTADGAATLEQFQNNDKGMMATGMVTAAVNDGNIAAAMRIRGQYNDFIPGYQQLAQDNLIHIAGMKQFAPAGVAALAAGHSIPEIAGMPPVQVRAVVANTAQNSGIDPNDALTVAQIESSMGTNVGTRGTIGQDKGSAGQPLDAQAKALCDNWKASHDPAATALGREPQGWEQYTVYQQGASGGPALLRADPNAMAVDVLKPFYANPKDALSAITKNGGNASMTVSDFLDQEKQRWTDSAERANCDFRPNNPPGNQIIDAHNNPGATVQPGANPAQDYRNWQRANILNVQQIMAMPSGPAREALLKENQLQTAKREGAANAYKSDLTNQGLQLMTDPKFSMDHVSPEMYQAIGETSPNLLISMENRSRENAAKGDPAQKEALEKGPAFHQLNVGTEQGAQNPTTLDAINQAYNGGQINSTAQDYLISKISGKKDADPNEASYKTNIENLAKNKIGFTTPENTLPESMAAYSDWKMAFDAYVAKAKTEGKSLNQIYDSKAVSSMIDQFTPGFNATVPSSGKPVQAPTLFQRLFSNLKSAAAQPANTPAPVPPKESLVVGQTYDLPRYGKAIWNGTNFVQQAGP